jgi:diaminopimelate decarboxylase
MAGVFVPSDYPSVTHFHACGFFRDDATLVCDGVGVASIAASVGTPTYLYSAAAIRGAYRRIDEALDPYPHAIHYALKANSTLAVARLLREMGSGVDANSGGEIETARRAGFEPGDIVFTGVGKSQRELEQAVALGLKAINVESSGEAERIDAVATALGRRARVAVRVNPDIDSKSHPHIATGLRTTKFGVPIEQAREICHRAARRPGTSLVGLHVHVGSQIVSLEPIIRGARAVADLAMDLRNEGLPIEHLDVGGGLGISYDGSSMPGLAEYGSALVGAVEHTGLVLLVEPGRALVGPAGALLTRVVDVKPRADGRHVVVVDAGMTELLRPALYGAFHRIEPIDQRPDPVALCDIVGPVCESRDVLGRDRQLPLPREGDLLAVLDTGAYGAVMASNYNRRLLPAEVVVDEGRWQLVRRRQTMDDLLALEE